MRSKSIYKSALIIYLSGIFVLLTSLAAAEKTKITLGGKGVFGPSFPSASTIANAVNQKDDDQGLQITVKSRRRSGVIIESVMAGEFEFGVVLNSSVYQAYSGLADWNGRPQNGLRSVCNVYPEQVALVASVESGIHDIHDLNNKRVFIGSPGSDLLYTVKDILAAAGIVLQTDVVISNTAIEAVPEMMQDDTIDAFFYILGTMNRTFIDLFSGSHKLVLVSIAGIGLDQLTANNPFYKKSIISTQSYPYFMNANDVETISVGAGLVTSIGVSDTIVYRVANKVFENRNEYIQRHPTARVLSRREMTKGMVVPVHSGADMFYQQSKISYSVVKP